MLTKRPKCVNTENLLFQRNSIKALPSISLQVPCLNIEHKNFSLTPKKCKKIIENFGFLNTSFIPGIRSKFRTSKISMTDIMGDKNCKELLVNKNLSSLKKKLEEKVMIEQIRLKRSLYKPGTPCEMDRNMMLRISLQEMKKRKKASISGSTSPYRSTKRLNVFVYN